MPDKRPWAGAIRSPADVRALLGDVNRAGLERATTTALAHAVQPGTDTELEPDATRLLPAPPELGPLLPWPGLRRGASIAVTGSASLLMLTLAAGMQHGSWAAVVGMPQFGVLAAHEYGIPLDRLALVADPGPDWPTVVAALIDGVELVVVQAPPGVSEATVRSLQARARQRGAVLIPTTAWPNSDLVITAGARQWSGLGHGRGRLRTQQLELKASGRGRAARPKTTSIVLPAPVPELRIPPPPPDLDAEPPTRESPLWVKVEPNEPPPDVWADLVEATRRRADRHRRRQATAT